MVSSTVWGMKRALAATIAGAAMTIATAAPGADPIVTQGIGTSSCSRLLADVNPAEGLSNPVNVMLFAWVQGYMSAANITLLEEEGKHIDMGAIDGGRVLVLMMEFCKANPDGKAVAMVDEMIRRSAKVQARWEPGTVTWDE